MRRQCWGKRGCTKPKLRWMNLESHLKRTLDNIKRLRLRDRQKDKKREREKKK